MVAKRPHGRHRIVTRRLQGHEETSTFAVLSDYKITRTLRFHEETSWSPRDFVVTGRLQRSDLVFTRRLQAYEEISWSTRNIMVTKRPDGH